MNSEEIAKALAEQGYFVSQSLVTPFVSEELRRAAQARLKKDLFRQARIGKGVKKKIRKEIRKDEIFWIDNWEQPPFSPYAELLHSLMTVFKRELFLPIKRFEGHMAHYAPNGFYKRHVDRHQVQPHRLISSVLYLNDVAEGGELVLYKGEGDEELFRLKPQEGLMIIFESGIFHEVKPTKVSRLSVTCWFRDDVL